jgi:transposase InsO family protein
VRETAKSGGNESLLRRGRPFHPLLIATVTGSRRLAIHPLTEYEWTYEKHRQRFGTLDEFLTFYNEERPHMSLDWDRLETPAEAFGRLVPSPATGGGDLLATEVTVDG